MTTARRFWTPAEREAFRRLDPHSLYLVGPDHPVSGGVHHAGKPERHWGETEGLLLVALGTNACPPWADKITAVWNKAPFWRTRLQARFWVPSEVHAERLELTMLRRFAHATSGAPLAGASWSALPAATTWDSVGGMVRDMAAVLGMPWCRDDTELGAECRRMALTQAERGLA